MQQTVTKPRGKLKIFMGYAAGVGKTFKMLQEAHSIQADGVDIAIGYFEPHSRRDTIALTEGLETIPRKKVEYRGTIFEEMDTEAILSRRPRVCVVDEFPHTNVPGSPRAKRWEDVQLLLDAGIDVLTTMNIQHLESLNDQVLRIAGIRVRETIPDWVVQRADEVVMMDLPAQALLNRLERGVVYARDKAEQARKNFFREEILVALRELALRQAAHEVEHRIEDVGHDSAADGGHPTETARQHRILILLTADPETAMLIRRAKRVSDFLHAECFAVSVETSNRHSMSVDDRDAVSRHLNFARNLHIEARVLEGEEVAPTVVDFARRNRITQIYLIRSSRERKWAAFSSKDLVRRIVALARDMQIVIVSPPEPGADS